MFTLPLVPAKPERAFSECGIFRCGAGLPLGSGSTQVQATLNFPEQGDGRVIKAPAELAAHADPQGDPQGLRASLWNER